MAYDKVIVFGPTGNIGSITAQTANKKGAKVYLAMRDPSKAIPGLDDAAEKAGNYERIKADLTEPDTILAAVQKSGAQAAFLYLAHGGTDHMLSTFQALKDGGIEHVVFLSSFTTPRSGLEDVSPANLISFIHTKAELSLRQVFAQDKLVAIRPGGFATNVLQSKPGIIDRKVKLLGTQIEFDWITNEDMGEVSGTILVEGQRDGEDFVYLFGPEMLTRTEAFHIIGKTLGENIEVLEVGPDEYREELLRGGLPPHIASALVKLSQEGTDGSVTMGLTKSGYEEGVKNIEKYTGHSALKFEEWAGRNKAMFS